MSGEKEEDVEECLALISCIILFDHLPRLTSPSHPAGDDVRTSRPLFCLSSIQFVLRCL